MHDAEHARTGFHCALIAGSVLLTWTETRYHDVDGALAWLLAALINWGVLFVFSLVLFLLAPFAVAARDLVFRLGRGRVG